MQPSFNPSEIKKLSDIWSNITNPSTTEPEKVEAPETPEASVETDTQEVEDNPVQDKLQSSGQFTDDELDRIAKADKWR